MKIKFVWINKEEIHGEVYVSESNPEEIARFYTRFSHNMEARWIRASVKKNNEEEGSAHYSVRAWYVDNEYYRCEYGTREEYILRIENRVKDLIERTDYSRDTNTTLMDAIVEELKREGLYGRFQAIEEYYLPEKMNVAILTRYEFDIITYVNYGSEGTWLDCYLDGKFDEGEKRKIGLGTFKTLKEDMEASLIMGELGGAITYVGDKYVNKNIDRFLPKDGEENE